MYASCFASLRLFTSFVSSLTCRSQQLSATLAIGSLLLRGPPPSLAVLLAVFHSYSWSWQWFCYTIGTRAKRKGSSQRPTQSHGPCFWRVKILTTNMLTRAKHQTHRHRFPPASVVSRARLATFRAASVSIRVHAYFDLGHQTPALSSVKKESGHPPVIDWSILSSQGRI